MASEAQMSEKIKIKKKTKFLDSKMKMVDVIQFVLYGFIIGLNLGAIIMRS